MRRAQPRIDSDRDLKTSEEMTISQNQRFSYLASVAEHPINLDEHVKGINVLPLCDVRGLLHEAPDSARLLNIQATRF